MRNISDRDDDLCRKLGWPTVTDQKAYWEDKEHILTTLQALTNTVKALTGSVEGLLGICRDQQTQINNLNERTK